MFNPLFYSFDIFQSGRLSCFLLGNSRSFPSITCNALTIRDLVCDGVIISSTKPFSAAFKGLAKASSYLAISSSAFLPLKMISTAPLAPMTAISAVGQA